MKGWTRKADRRDEHPTRQPSDKLFLQLLITAIADTIHGRAVQAVSPLFDVVEVEFILDGIALGGLGGLGDAAGLDAYSHRLAKLQSQAAGTRTIGA
jgi:hypothetical protein